MNNPQGINIRGFIAVFADALRCYDDVEDIPTRDKMIMARVRKKLGVKDGPEQG